MKFAHSAEVKKELPSLEGTKGCTVQWLITAEDGALHYAMRLFTLEPGGLIPIHTHDTTEHEIFIVEGNGTFTHGDKEILVNIGDAIFVKPGEPHSFKNTSNTPLRLICVIPLE
jgi:quercetin dioxygenase-like cupin family protein